MDYSVNPNNHIDTHGTTLYITNTSIDGNIAHNGYNFSNFLWGAGANALGIPEFEAKMGAQLNNYYLDPLHKGTWDSVDDQFSIGVGYNWINNSITKINPILIYGVYGAAYLK
jgi:hypothetical protein